MICVQRRRVHITTHISRRFSPKQRKFHERLCRPCLLGGWEKKERKNLYRCLLFGRAFVRCSIQSRWFSVVVHNENFRVEKLPRIYFIIFSASSTHQKYTKRNKYRIYRETNFSHTFKKEFSFCSPRARWHTRERSAEAENFVVRDANLQPASSFFSLSFNSTHNKKQNSIEIRHKNSARKPKTDNRQLPWDHRKNKFE